MADNQYATEISQDTFRTNFQKLVPLICEEWPQVDRQTLEQASGDLDKAVNHIAQITDQSKVMIRRHLAELNYLASPSGVTSFDLDTVMSRIEQQYSEVLQRLREDAYPQMRDRARENIGTTILSALGIGLLLGLIIGASTSRNRE